MSSIEEIEDTVAVLREQNGLVRSDASVAVSQASDARRLAAGASSDVTDVEQAQRGIKRVVEALRETQIEQGEKIEQNFAELKSDVAELKAGIFQIVHLLGGERGE